MATDPPHSQGNFPELRQTSNSRYFGLGKSRNVSKPQPAPECANLALNQPVETTSVPTPALSSQSFWQRPHPWIVLIGLTVALRFVAMFTTPLEAHEAYYWMYAQHPNLSYFDHPPMVAWVIGLGSFIFGDTEFGVRIVGCLMMMAAGVLLCAHARIWFGRTASLIAGTAVLVLPVYFGNGFVATMDGPLVFYWSLGLFAVSKALSSGRTAWWYLAGLALGGAMLSKYTGVFIGLGGFIATLGHPQRRRHLLSIHPYLACLLGAAMFGPVIAWNATHDWASFRFQFFDRFQGRGISASSPLAFLGMQFAVATPIVLVGAVLVFAWVIRRRSRLCRPRWWIAASFSAPLLAIMAYKSLRAPIHINWTLPAYLGLFPPVAHFTILTSRHVRRSVGALRGLFWVRVTAAIALTLNLAIVLVLVSLPAGSQGVAAFGKWKLLAHLVHEHEERLEAETGKEPLVVAQGEYRLAALLAFYRTPLEHSGNSANFTTSQWAIGGDGLGFEYWARSKDWLGLPGVVVAPLNHPLDATHCFTRTQTVDDPRLAAIGFQVVLCYDYKGPRSLAKAR